MIVAALLLAILMGIGWLFGDGGLIGGLIIWMACIKGVHLLIMHYFGYLLKAGHVAVIA